MVAAAHRQISSTSAENFIASVYEAASKPPKLMSTIMSNKFTDESWEALEKRLDSAERYRLRLSLDSSSVMQPLPPRPGTTPLPSTLAVKDIGTEELLEWYSFLQARVEHTKKNANRARNVMITQQNQRMQDLKERFEEFSGAIPEGLRANIRHDESQYPSMLPGYTIRFAREYKPRALDGIYPTPSDALLAYFVYLKKWHQADGKVLSTLQKYADDNLDLPEPLEREKVAKYLQKLQDERAEWEDALVIYNELHNIRKNADDRIGYVKSQMTKLQHALASRGITKDMLRTMMKNSDRRRTASQQDGEKRVDSAIDVDESMEMPGGHYRGMSFEEVVREREAERTRRLYDTFCNDPDDLYPDDKRGG